MLALLTNCKHYPIQGHPVNYILKSMQRHKNTRKKRGTDCTGGVHQMHRDISPKTSIQTWCRAMYKSQALSCTCLPADTPSKRAHGKVTSCKLCNQTSNRKRRFHQAAWHERTPRCLPHMSLTILTDHQPWTSFEDPSRIPWLLALAPVLHLFCFFAFSTPFFSVEVLNHLQKYHRQKRSVGVFSQWKKQCPYAFVQTCSKHALTSRGSFSIYAHQNLPSFCSNLARTSVACLLVSRIERALSRIILIFTDSENSSKAITRLRLLWQHANHTNAFASCESASNKVRLWMGLRYGNALKINSVPHQNLAYFMGSSVIILITCWPLPSRSWSIKCRAKQFPYLWQHNIETSWVTSAMRSSIMSAGKCSSNRQNMRTP